MPFDVNNQYTGTVFGKDRIGHTTPDAEATETLRPWLPVGYPAPYLPCVRQAQGHPVLAGVVLSSQYLLAQDKSGALVPCGMISGDTGVNAGHATGAGYFAIKYGQADVDFGTICPLTVGAPRNLVGGNPVTVAGTVVVLACPSNGSGVAGDVITFPDGTTYTIVTADLTAALACDLFPQGAAKPVGVALRDVFSYMGETKVSSATGGISYTLNGVIPLKWKMHNYMHEMATAIQTSYVLRLPWIGATPTTLATIATGASLTNYAQSNYGRSFVHFTGTKGLADGQLHHGALVVGSRALMDQGHYAPYNSTTHDVSDVCGRVIAIQAMYPIRDYANRVKTLWNPSRLGGPMKDPNPASIMMGGSATAGIDYQLNLGTDGLFKAMIDGGVDPTTHPEAWTFVYVKINL